RFRRIEVHSRRGFSFHSRTPDGYVLDQRVMLRVEVHKVDDPPAHINLLCQIHRYKIRACHRYREVISGRPSHRTGQFLPIARTFPELRSQREIRLVGWLGSIEFDRWDISDASSPMLHSRASTFQSGSPIRASSAN